MRKVFHQVHLSVDFLLLLLLQLLLFPFLSHTLLENCFLPSFILSLCPQFRLEDYVIFKLTMMMTEFDVIYVTSGTIY